MNNILQKSLNRDEIEFESDFSFNVDDELQELEVEASIKDISRAGSVQIAFEPAIVATPIDW